MAELHQFTNLAGEFYVLSVLNRMHIESYLTLGNAKGVDIACFGKNGKFDVEVKTIMNINNTWMLGGRNPTEGHETRSKFYIFVKIDDNRKTTSITQPEAFIIPEIDLIRNNLLLDTKGGFVLDGIRANPRGGQSETKEEAQERSRILAIYKEAWYLLCA